MKELVENVEKQITTDKEVISVLPRNGIKALKTLLQTIKDMIDKYDNVNEKLLKEMAALQEENNRLKKALGKRALNTIKNL